MSGEVAAVNAARPPPPRSPPIISPDMDPPRRPEEGLTPANVLDSERTSPALIFRRVLSLLARRLLPQLPALEGLNEDFALW